MKVFAAPKIVEAIAAGHPPPELTAKVLTERIELPLLWSEQETIGRNKSVSHVRDFFESLCPPQLLSESGPNGRAKSANRDFGRELPITFRNVVFSATTRMQMRPWGRAFRRFERRLRRDGDSVAERGGLETAVSREAFPREKLGDCLRNSLSRSANIVQRMNSLSVRHPCPP